MEEVAVPRYFFDLQDDVARFPDEFGDEFVSVEEARKHVQAILMDTFRSALPGGDERLFVCELRDETDNVVYRGRLVYQGETPFGPG